ncbi:hypothetical protein PISMIDRAFT_44296, partial [Pisolithus microcarpus 441]
GTPCDMDGLPLPRGTPPKLPETKLPDNWFPYSGQLEFKLTNFLYTQNQMPADHIDMLFDLWAVSLIEAGGQPKLLFKCHKDLYNMIDQTHLGDVKWQSFTIKYSGNLDELVPWMQAHFDIWFCCPLETVHNILSNPDFTSEVDYRPYCEYDSKSSKCCKEELREDFMSGDWAWDQAV